jgi:hypothetical protein
MNSKTLVSVVSFLNQSPGKPNLKNETDVRQVMIFDRDNRYMLSQVTQVVTRDPISVRARRRGVIWDRPDQLVAIDHYRIVDIGVVGTRFREVQVARCSPRSGLE